jgi:hypothetical protein
MKKAEREQIIKDILYELETGTHTYTMCKCGRRGCRSGLCYECLLEKLE